MLSVFLNHLSEYTLTSLCLQLTKVAILGAGGGIGQPLSLLMKLNPRVTELALYDIRGGPGPFIRPRKEEHGTDKAFTQVSLLMLATLTPRAPSRAMTQRHRASENA
jgi:hypothetical protein